MFSSDDAPPSAFRAEKIDEAGASPRTFLPDGPSAAREAAARRRGKNHP